MTTTAASGGRGLPHRSARSRACTPPGQERKTAGQFGGGQLTPTDDHGAKGKTTEVVADAIGMSQEEPVPHQAHHRGVPDAVEREQLRASVGAALRQARRRAGLSQPQLAALAGCHRRTVQRLEAGQLRPTEALLAALAHALTVPPGWSQAGRRAMTAALLVELEAAAGPSLVLASGRRARWRRRRHRTAYRAVSRSALPMLRAGAAGGGQLAAMLHEAAEMVQAAERLLP